MLDIDTNSGNHVPLAPICANRFRNLLASTKEETEFIELPCHRTGGDNPLEQTQPVRFNPGVASPHGGLQQLRR
jgi:hypothetical protein